MIFLKMKPYSMKILSFRPNKLKQRVGQPARQGTMRLESRGVASGAIDEGGEDTNYAS